jgi:hypothetical protein
MNDMRVLPILMVMGTIGLTSMDEAPARQGDFEWSARLSAGQTLTVRGINGPIVAAGTSGATATVTATKHANDHGDPADVRIEVVERADGVTICAVYPGQGRDADDPCASNHSGKNGQQNNTEVRFRVAVPSGVLFRGMTVSGDVEATDLSADAWVTTVNGDVQVSTAGTAEAQTVNGDITVWLGESSWDGALGFQTVNGSIDVHLPATVAATVRAQSMHGELVTDFPLQLQGRWGPRRLTGTIGDGGGRIDAQTVNGAIRLLER